MRQLTNELRDKIQDGILPAVLFFLVMLVSNLVGIILNDLFNRLGVMVFVLLLLALGMYCLEQSVLNRHSEAYRAFIGAMGGVLAWEVVSLSKYLGANALNNLAGLVLLILVAMVVAILWQRGLPFGVKYFSTVFLLNWTILLLLGGLYGYFNWSSVFVLCYRILGVAALIASFGTLVYIIWQSISNTQRIRASVYLWGFLVIGLFMLGIQII